jgi:hypothetical protein
VRISELVRCINNRNHTKRTSILDRHQIRFFDAGFSIVDRDQYPCLNFLGLVHGMYNESGVGARFDEGMQCKQTAKKV